MSRGEKFHFMNPLCVVMSVESVGAAHVVCSVDKHKTYNVDTYLSKGTPVYILEPISRLGDFR